jgi:hypothetical protein
MDGYKIRVQSHSDPSIYGESQAFALIKPEIGVISPRGGWRFTLGDPMTIEWDCSCLDGQVPIDLIDSGGTFKRIDTVDSSDRTYSWSAGIFERHGEYYYGEWGAPSDGAPVERESVTGDNLKIRVTSEYSSTLYGESHPFYIHR